MNITETARRNLQLDPAVEEQLAIARKALEAAATLLERDHGKGNEAAELVLAEFDRVCELHGPSDR